MANIFDLFRSIEGEKASPAARAPVSALIVGLGNPGKEYERTRHNVGFFCLDALAAACRAELKSARFHALCGEALIGEHRVLLLKPQTYMNLSGGAVREAAAFYHIPPERVIVFSDDTALPPGKMRIRQKGSAGGHNGLRDIIEALGTDAFPRIRFGVGAPPPGGDLKNWVTGTIPAPDREAIEGCAAALLPCVTLMLDGDYGGAMNQYNR